MITRYYSGKRLRFQAKYTTFEQAINKAKYCKKKYSAYRYFIQKTNKGCILYSNL